MRLYSTILSMKYVYLYCSDASMIFNRISTGDNKNARFGE